MASAKPITRQIRLNYNFAKWTMTTTPRTIRTKKGEAIEFVSPQGQVHVLLKPAAAYQPAEYRTGDPPVIVKRVAKGKFWCGGTFKVGSEVIKINPADRKYGSTSNPDPPVDGGSGT